MSSIGIIITVPHSKCDTNTQVRNCDKRSGEIASCLYDNLVYHFGKKYVMLFQSDIYRSSGDYNRSSTSNTDWRKTIRKKLDELIDDDNISVIWHLDIHSFPNGSFANDARFVLLNNDTAIREGKAFFGFLGDNIKNNKGYYFYEGSTLNDLQKEFKDKDGKNGKGIFSLLMEFNESNADNEDILIKNISAFILQVGIPIGKGKWYECSIL